MNPDFVNLYIGKLLKEIEEATKTRLLISAQLEYSESIVKELSEKLEKIEKTNSKKVVKKEVDTSETF